MKKLPRILLLIFFVLLLVACSNGIVDKDDAIQSAPAENKAEDIASTETSDIDPGVLASDEGSNEVDASVDRDNVDEKDSGQKSATRTAKESSSPESKSSGERAAQSTSKSSSAGSKSSEQTGSQSASKPSSSGSKSSGQPPSPSNDSTSTKSSNVGSSEKRATPSTTENKTPTGNSTSDSNMITVTISIDAKTAHAKGYVNYEYILRNTKVQIERGSSVWDVLNKVARSNGIPVVKKGSGDSLYVAYINSIGEFDFNEPGSGWEYNVNGVYSNYGADNKRISLKDGDAIQWRFTLNLGKDLGAH